jgi:hypothetical protein
LLVNRAIVALLSLPLGLAAVGCGGAPLSTRAAKSPAASVSVTSPAASASATTQATASPSPSGELTCRLPLVTSNGQSQQAGFLSFPSGAFQPDPKGAIASKGSGLAYDRGYNRWLPVDWRWVSDDGTHYVYATYSDSAPSIGSYSVIHVVTVATGADRIVARTGQYVINDYVGNEVYLSPWVGGHDGPGPQIGWVLDPSSGALRQLPGGTRYGYWVAGGAGWRTDYNPADPTVHQGMTGPNRLIRVDITSGVETTWFYQQGADWVQVLGFDSQSHPIVLSGVQAGTNPTIGIWILNNASDRTPIYSGSQTMNWALADSHGIWLSDGGFVYLYSAGSLRKMALAGGQFAGGCH